MFELLNTKLHTYGISPALLIGLFVVSLMLSMPLMAQVCDGNLGENIFTDGDFGRGNTNVVSTDPQIAPGYHYEPHPPPNDGSYTITNYTGLWNLFPGWLQIRDNSTDQFGYMMVVNASYEPGLFYEKEILDLCENTLYEFSADIINMLSSGSNMIKPNVSFLLDAVVMYNTGEIPEDEKWNTYGFTFTTAPGQFSVKLSLQNNAPGGMGNDLALDNIAFRPCGPEALILPKELSNICEDGDPILLSATLVGNQFDTPSYQWQQSFDEGGSWQDIPAAIGSQISHTDLSGGYYHYRYLVANGDDNLSNSKCRIVSNVKIVHVHPKAYDLVDTICEGHGYRVGDNVYSTTGEYEDSLIGAIGCDSIVRLTLTVMPYTGMQTEYTYSHPSCSYLEDGTFYVENISSGWPPYHFSFGGEPKNIDQTITNLPGGSYFFSITDHFGCGIEDSVTLISPHPFVVDLGPDFQIAVGALIQIVPSTNYSISEFLWEPQDLIDCSSNCWELKWSPPHSTYVSLTATSDHNCAAIDSVYVAVDDSRKINIPNAFTPNNDGLNDAFYVMSGGDNVQKIEFLAVYNRWGTLVFESINFQPNESHQGWDGSYMNEPLDSGTYAYIADVLFLDGMVIRYQGTVQLLR